MRKEFKANTFFRYETRKVDDLMDNICPHFDQYLLLSGKKEDYRFFKHVLKILQKERKPTKKSFWEIIDLVYEMNLISANDKSSKKESKEHWLEIIEDNY